MRKRGREDGNRPQVKLASSKVWPLAPHRPSRGCFGAKLLEDSLSLARAHAYGCIFLRYASAGLYISPFWSER